MKLTTIVLGLDGSKGSESACRWCAGLALMSGAQVVAVHGLGALPEFVLSLPPSRLGPWKRELQEAIHRWCEPLRAAGVPHREELVEHNPVEAVLGVADKENADMILVGAQGDGGPVHRLLGGVTYKIAHHAHRPVVIVPSDYESRSA